MNAVFLNDWVQPFKYLNKTWNTVDECISENGPDFVGDMIFNKFAQNRNIRSILLQTGDTNIVHNGIKQNELMKVRFTFQVLKVYHIDKPKQIKTLAEFFKRK